MHPLAPACIKGDIFSTAQRLVCDEPQTLRAVRTDGRALSVRNVPAMVSARWRSSVNYQQPGSRSCRRVRFRCSAHSPRRLAVTRSSWFCSCNTANRSHISSSSSGSENGSTALHTLGSLAQDRVRRLFALEHGPQSLLAHRPRVDPGVVLCATLQRPQTAHRLLQRRRKPSVTLNTRFRMRSSSPLSSVLMWRRPCV